MTDTTRSKFINVGQILDWHRLRGVAAIFASIPATADPLTYLRKRLQRQGHTLELKFDSFQAEQFICERLARWLARIKMEPKLAPLTPAAYATHFVANMQRLHKLVPPRVASPVYNTYFNRWCTARRFQKTGRCPPPLWQHSRSGQHRTLLLLQRGCRFRGFILTPGGPDEGHHALLPAHHWWHE